MATTKIWDIKGRIDKVIDYAANPEKTNSQSFSAKDLQSLRDVMDYAMADYKTEEQFFVSGINCEPDIAREQMKTTKAHWQKNDGIIAFHSYQSFKPGEVTPETAHEIGCELARRMWGDRFEVVVATHLNTNCLHNHFVLNSVSFVDGKKYNDCNAAYRELRGKSDALCREYGLSVIENPGTGVKKCYPEATAERDGGYTKNSIIRRDIDGCIGRSTTPSQFWKEMVLLGYTLDNSRKYMTVMHPDFAKPRRLKTLGEEYSENAITNRIHNRMRREPPDDTPQEKIEDLFFDGDIANAVTIVGYRSMYIHFSYGVKIVSERPTSNRRMYFLLRDDLLKLDKIIAESNFLCDNGIDTPEQLEKYKTAAQRKIDDLISERAELRNEIKRAERCGDEPRQTEIKGQVFSISAQLKKLRAETKLFNSIAERARHIEEKMLAAQAEAEKRESEEKDRQRGGKPKPFSRSH